MRGLSGSTALAVTDARSSGSRQGDEHAPARARSAASVVCRWMLRQRRAAGPADPRPRQPDLGLASSASIRNRNHRVECDHGRGDVGCLIFSGRELLGEWRKVMVRSSPRRHPSAGQSPAPARRRDPAAARARAGGSRARRSAQKQARRASRRARRRVFDLLQRARCDAARQAKRSTAGRALRELPARQDSGGAVRADDRCVARTTPSHEERGRTRSEGRATHGSTPRRRPPGQKSRQLPRLRPLPAARLAPGRAPRATTRDRRRRAAQSRDPPASAQATSFTTAFVKDRRCSSSSGMIARWCSRGRAAPR